MFINVKVLVLAPFNSTVLVSVFVLDFAFSLLTVKVKGSLSEQYRALSPTQTAESETQTHRVLRGEVPQRGPENIFEAAAVRHTHSHG